MSATASIVTGVDFITVPTRDFEAADRFYGDVLGLERSKRWGDMPAGEFENGTVTIAIMQSDAFGLEFSPHSHPIAFQVDDVAAARAALEDWARFDARFGILRAPPDVQRAFRLP